MKFVEFKNHIYKRFINELGFVKIDKAYLYRNDEVGINIYVQKSDYSNAAYVRIGINPKDILDNWNLDMPTIYGLSQIILSLNWEKSLYELDDMELSQIDEDIDDFSKDVFPHLLSIEKLKEYYKDRQKNLMPFIREFWYGIPEEDH